MNKEYSNAGKLIPLRGGQAWTAFVARYEIKLSA